MPKTGESAISIFILCSSVKKYIKKKSDSLLPFSYLATDEFKTTLTGKLLNTDYSLTLGVNNEAI